MATGENINTYTGNAALAQGTAGGEGAFGVPEMKATLDALDKTVYYKFLENRDRWTRENVLADKDALDAAEMSKFPLAEWLDQDTQEITNRMNTFSQQFAADPTATRLRYDPKTGKVMNRENFLKLQAAHNNVYTGIYHANTRISKAHTIRDKIEAMPEGSPQRVKAEAWYANQLKQPFSADLVTPPDWDVYDISQMVPLTYENTEGTRVPGEQLISNTTFKLPNIPASINAQMVAMNNPKNYAQADMINTMLTQFRDIVDKQRIKTPGLSDADLAAELKKSDPGNIVSNYYSVYNSMKKQTDAAIQSNEWLKDSPAMDPIQLHDLTTKDIVGMVLASTGSVTRTQTLQSYTGLTTAEESRRWWADYNLRKQVADLQKQMYETKTDASSVAASALTAVVGIAEYPEISGVAPVQGFSADVQQLLPAGKNTMDQYVPPNMKDNTEVYEVPLNPIYENMLRKPGATMQTKTQPGGAALFNPDGSVATDTQATPGETVTQTNQEIVGNKMWILRPRGSDDVNQQRYMVLYKDPTKPDSVPQSVILDNQGLLLASTHIFDQGKASAKELADYSKAIQTTIQKAGLPPAANMSDLVQLVQTGKVGISGAPAAPGGTTQTKATTITKTVKKGVLDPD